MLDPVNQPRIDELKKQFEALQVQIDTYSALTAEWLGKGDSGKDSDDPSKVLFIANKWWELKQYAKAQKSYGKYLALMNNRIIDVDLEGDLQQFDKMADIVNGIISPRVGTDWLSGE